MTARRYVLALDQGTTGTTALVVEPTGAVLARLRRAPAALPQPGWVEHDPEEIWRPSCRPAGPALRRRGDRDANRGDRHHQPARDRRSCGTGRRAARSTARSSGRAGARRRSATRSAPTGCRALDSEKTGLVLDPYFSGTKIAWLLDRSRAARRRAERGELAFGTVDSWLVWQAHRRRGPRDRRDERLADAALDLRTRDWGDGDAGDLRRSARRAAARSCRRPALSARRPASACALRRADRGHRRRSAGRALRPGVLRAGRGQEHLRHRMLSAAEHGADARRLRARAPRRRSAWRSDGDPTYALEGSVFIAGAAIQWLRDGLGLIRSAAESEALAESVRDTGGVVFVPAFVGLGAPYWDPTRAARSSASRAARRGAHRARGARGDRLPEPRRAGGDGRGREAAVSRAACRRRRGGQRSAHASSRPTFSVASCCGRR